VTGIGRNEDRYISGQSILELASLGSAALLLRKCVTVSQRVALFVLGMCLAVTASCETKEVPISSKVLVDGAPMDSGTLRFDPIEGTGGKGAGGMIEAGVLQLSSNRGLLPGKYRVSATAFKKTGKTIKDYQRGNIEEMIQLSLKDSPHEIELSRDATKNNTIEFKSAPPKR
jgi:hypothetical protein